MDDDIEIYQSSQESDSDVDIGMKASMYTSATLKEMYTVGLTLRNNLYISLVQELAATCIRYYWNNVDVLIVACAIAESYAIAKDSERQCPQSLKILNIRPEQPNVCRTVIASARDLGVCTFPLLEI
jgi:hypothetical protein